MQSRSTTLDEETYLYEVLSHANWYLVQDLSAVRIQQNEAPQRTDQRQAPVTAASERRASCCEDKKGKAKDSWRTACIARSSRGDVYGTSVSCMVQNFLTSHQVAREESYGRKHQHESHVTQSREHFCHIWLPLQRIVCRWQESFCVNWQEFIGCLWSCV